MRYLALILIASIGLSSCATWQKSKTLDQVKANLICVEYASGIAWAQIRERLGAADVAPLPDPGTNLQSNSRVYRNKWVIFSVENAEVQEDGKTRFREIANKIEVCTEK
jgi:hypothetical protein